MERKCERCGRRVLRQQSFFERSNVKKDLCFTCEQEDREKLYEERQIERLNRLSSICYEMSNIVDGLVKAGGIQ